MKVDGSGRLTLRNRQHLRKFIPFRVQPLDVESLSPAVPAEEPVQPPRELPIVPEPLAQEESVVNPVVPDLFTEQESAENTSCPAVESPPRIDHHSPSSTEFEGKVPLLQPNPTIFPRDPPLTENNQRDSPIAAPKMPRALARLQPHNAPGIKEAPPDTLTRGSRRRPNLE